MSVSWSETDVAYVLAELGYAQIQIGTGWVKTACPCSNKGKSLFFKCSDQYRGPGYVCHRCHATGTLASLIFQRWGQGYNVTRLIQIMTAYESSMVSSVDVSSMEYGVGSKKVRKEHQFAPSLPKVTHGVQIDLTGKVEEFKPSTVSVERYMQFPPGPAKSLLKKGFTRETQERFGIRGDPNMRRAVIPVWDADGVLRGWSRRLGWSGTHCFDCGTSIMKNGSMVHRCPGCDMLYSKYVHSRGFRRNEILFGENLGPGIPVLVEGMTDVMRLWQGGLREPLAAPRAVLGATLAVSQAQILVKQHPKGPICIMRDRDDPSKYSDLHGVGPGDVAAAQFRSVLAVVAPDRQVVDFIPPRWLDPGDLTMEHVGWARERIRVLSGDDWIIEIPESP